MTESPNSERTSDPDRNPKKIENLDKISQILSTKFNATLSRTPKIVLKKENIRFCNTQKSVKLSQKIVETTANTEKQLTKETRENDNVPMVN